jgi:hypothetical protein
VGLAGKALRAASLQAGELVSGSLRMRILGGVNPGESMNKKLKRQLITAAAILVAFVVVMAILSRLG